MRLSVITDEIDALLGASLDVCEELGLRAVELRAVDGVSIVDYEPDRRVLAVGGCDPVGA